MSSLSPVQTELINDASASGKPPFYRVLWVQVLFAMVLAIVLGYVDPVRAVSMKPLGDAFIRLITMIITLIIFCTVVTGIAGMDSLKKVDVSVAWRCFTSKLFRRLLSSSDCWWGT